MPLFFKKKAFVLKLNLESLSISLLCFFLLFFPKGGIKIFNIPLTTGYLLLLFTAGVSLLSFKPLISKPYLYTLFAFLPFQALSAFTILHNGCLNNGYAISLFLNFFVFPWIFFCIFPRHIHETSLTKILSLVKSGVFFVAAFGIFLFIYKFLTGSFIEIPLLTVNYHDQNEMELTKCIDRGGIFKLISTYNNGNLYGVCILMMLPLYQVLEQRRIRKLIVIASLVLTLSRTIWFGLIFVEVLFAIALIKPFWKKALYFIVALLFSLISYKLISSIFPLSIEFLFDRFLGNRIGQLDALQSLSLFSKVPFEEIYEIVYLGVIKSFGLLGLLFYLIAMIAPILIGNLTKANDSPCSFLQKPLTIGLITYLFLSFGDGALLLIPVLVFYFTLCMLLLSLSQKPQEMQPVSTLP